MQIVRQGGRGRRMGRSGTSPIRGASGGRSRLIHPHASHGSSKVYISVQALSLAVAPVCPAMIHSAHAMGVFRRNERFERDDGRDPGIRCMEAAARLGVLMAETSQRGFEVFTVHGGRPPLLPPFRPSCIRIEVLARLCLVADPDRSSFVLRVGEPRWMGRLLGGLGGARRVWGCGGRVGRLGVRACR